MALKRKLDKAGFDALSPEFQAEYKEKDGVFHLDTDDATGLQNALDAQKRANDEQRTRLEALEKAAKEAKDKEDEAVAERNRKGKDYDALETSYKEKLAKQEADAKAAQDKLQTSITAMLVENKAIELANDLGGDNAEILLPHIRSRLKADFDGDTPVTRVLDKAGAVSASTLDDLKKEFVDNPKFGAILVGTRASGGDAKGSPTPSGKTGGKEPKDMNDAERADLLKTNPTLFHTAFPHVAAASA